MKAIHVVGLSCRSLAHSLQVLGLEVIAYDSYSDRDLKVVASTRSWQDLERDLQPDVIRREHVFMFAGGMENRLDIVDRVHALRTLVGPDPAQMRSLRSIEVLKSIASRCSLQFPQTLQEAEAIGSMAVAESCSASHAEWLVKPVSSGGGLGIRRWRGESLSKDHYLQRRIDGVPLSTILLLSTPPENPTEYSPHRIETSRYAPARSRLLGVTAPVRSDEWPAPDLYWYRGSIERHPSQIHQELAQNSLGTVEASKDFSLSLEERLGAFGNLLAAELGIRGLLQADWILDRGGDLWLLEVNPRWTASAEVIEWSRGWNLAAMQLHAYAALPKNLAMVPLGQPSSEADTNGGRIVGKTIAYAQRSYLISAMQSDGLFSLTRSRSKGIANQACGDWWLADIPCEGVVIEKDQPLVSILATGRDRSEVLRNLHRGADRLWQVIEP